MSARLIAAATSRADLVRLPQNRKPDDMHKILITAFEPFLHYPTNASEQILKHWLEDHPGSDRSTFQAEILPVDFHQTEVRLFEVWQEPFDFALHLGQSPLIDRFNLELIALNVKADRATPIGSLDENGPAAFKTDLPLAAWCEDLSQVGTEAEVSFHAGTYLCNATYYWSTRQMHQQQMGHRSLFVHVPLIEMDVPAAQDQIRSGSKMLSRLVRLIEDYLDECQA